VLYVNGIALGVLELKRSTVSVSEGIRQNLDNQKRVHPALLRHRAAGHGRQRHRGPALRRDRDAGEVLPAWKEETTIIRRLTTPARPAADPALRKARLLEIIHDFIVFDAGIKKVCRHNQYFGVKAAQERVRRREGGIIWHTQGSGKSLIMVWLAKWIREHVPDARVLIITDRTELDEQIEKVFKGVTSRSTAPRAARTWSPGSTTEPWLIAR
jgi:type I restriction enzyme, R subunit